LYVYVCLSDDEIAQANGWGGPINISWRIHGESWIGSRESNALWEPSKYLYIAIPPEFTPPVDWEAGFPDAQTTNLGLGETSNIETTITNDHNMIFTGKFNGRHQVAPGWWFVRISSTPEDFPQDQIARVTQMNPAFDPKYTDDTTDEGQYTRGSSGLLYPPNMDPWLDRQIRPDNTNDIESEFAGCYRIKIHDMKAPNCAGKYFFKVFFTDKYLDVDLQRGWREAGWLNGLGIYQAGASDPAAQDDFIEPDPFSGYANGWFEAYWTFPPENYPVILVKGEVDPGYISGTVRYCGHSQYYYGQFYGEGVHTSGKVVAEGTALDPITNEPIGRPVCAIGWFLGELPGQDEDWKARDTGSQGFYEVEGVAAGVYTLTAYAAGFVPRTLPTQITVKRGQSIHGVDIYVCPTAKLQTKVYSKCPTGPVDFPEYVTMDFYPHANTILPVVPGGSDVRGIGPGPQGVPVGPDGIYFGGTSWSFGAPVAPPSHNWLFGNPGVPAWSNSPTVAQRTNHPAGVHGAATVFQKDVWAAFSSGVPVNVAATGVFAESGVAGSAHDQNDIIPVDKGRYGWAWQELVDVNGTVVAWQDFTFDLWDNNRVFGTFWGDPSCYSGVETGWDGHVPTFLADFTSGIIPGSYRVRTWVFGYVQTREYVVDFPAVEFPGTTYIEMDIFKGGVITPTVHYHQQELPSAEIANLPQFAGYDPIIQMVILEAVDANGEMQGFAMSENPHQPVDPFFTPAGLQQPGITFFNDPAYDPDGPGGTYAARAYYRALMGDSNAWVNEGRVTGLPEGTYTIKAGRHRFVQQEFPQHTVQYCTNGTLSFHLIKGAMVDFTVFSRDCQDPTQPVEWQHPGEPIEVVLTGSGGDVFAPMYYLQAWHQQFQGTDQIPDMGRGTGDWAFWGGQMEAAQDQATTTEHTSMVGACRLIHTRSV
jgi:hypothetical protein